MDARKERKERVLHTRISAALEDEIRKVAEALRVPVSNVVRTLLEDSVKAMGRVSDRVHAEIERDRAELQRRWIVTRDAFSALRRGRKAGGAVASGPREAGVAAGNGAAAPAVVYAWQAVVVGQETACAQCAASLLPGQDAFLGLTDAPGERPFRCPSCVPRAPGARRHDPQVQRNPQRRSKQP